TLEEVDMTSSTDIVRTEDAQLAIRDFRMTGRLHSSGISGLNLRRGILERGHTLIGNVSLRDVAALDALFYAGIAGARFERTWIKLTKPSLGDEGPAFASGQNGATGGVATTLDEVVLIGREGTPQVLSWFGDDLLQARRLWVSSGGGVLL